MVKIAVFTEGDFDSIETQPTAEEARGFARGVTCGANHYGAGGCAAYALPEEDAKMRANESKEACASADKALAKETS